MTLVPPAPSELEAQIPVSDRVHTLIAARIEERAQVQRVDAMLEIGDVSCVPRKVIEDKEVDAPAARHDHRVVAGMKDVRPAAPVQDLSACIIGSQNEFLEAAVRIRLRAPAK